MLSPIHFLAARMFKRAFERAKRLDAGTGTYDKFQGVCERLESYMFRRGMGPDTRQEFLTAIHTPEEN